MIDKNDKKQLLIIAAFFHDIGKKETIMVKDGSTSCKGHELVSVEKTSRILERFNLSPAEKKYIIRIISNHGRLHDLMSDVSRKKLADEYKKIKLEISDIIYEIILFTKADMMGGDLKKKSPDEFNFRMNFYNKAIKRITAK